MPVGQRLRADVQAAGELGGGSHSGPADFAEHLLLAEGQAVVAAMATKLAGQGHDRFPQLGGVRRGRDVITKLYLGISVTNISLMYAIWQVHTWNHEASGRCW